MTGGFVTTLVKLNNRKLAGRQATPECVQFALIALLTDNLSILLEESFNVFFRHNMRIQVANKNARVDCGWVWRVSLISNSSHSASGSTMTTSVSSASTAAAAAAVTATTSMVTVSWVAVPCGGLAARQATE